MFFSMICGKLNRDLNRCKTLRAFLIVSASSLRLKTSWNNASACLLAPKHKVVDFFSNLYSGYFQTSVLSIGEHSVQRRLYLVNRIPTLRQESHPCFHFDLLAFLFEQLKLFQYKQDRFSHQSF